MGTSSPSRRPLRVCIVTPEFLGVNQSTLLAASIAGFAEEITAVGDSVTVLVVPEPSFKPDASEIAHIRRHYFDHHGIQVDLLIGSDRLLPTLHSSAKSSLAAYHHLHKQKFDAVYFTAESGLGYYPILGREVGTYASPPKLLVLAHEPLAWEAVADRFYPKTTMELETAHMERYTIENCEELIFSSEEVKRFLLEQGWSVSKTAPIMPDFLPAEWASEEHVDPRATAVQELVLFGGSGFGKGLTLFCDILDKLAEEDLPPLKVTLLGPFDRILGEHTGGMLLRRGRRWPFTLNLMPRATPQETIAYLKHRNCLVVSPALAAAAPFDEALCLEEGIPLLASRVGGIPAMIAKSDRERCLCEPNAAAFADRIKAILQTGARSAAPAQTLATKRRMLATHLEKVARSTSSVAAHPKRIEATAKKAPLVSIVMAHHDRPDLVHQAIGSVERQDYRNVELILVDDGSKNRTSHETLDQLEPTFAKRNWRILREPNRYLGAARNAGIRAARGERILFLDDDNILLDHAVSTFVSAMDHSGADICTCLSKILYGRAEPTTEALGLVQYFPLGGSLDLGFLHNSFGDANAMIRRTVFDRIGYLVEDYGFVAQDWEFFARAALNGLKVRIIPEPLYWYRSDPQAMYRSSHWWNTRELILRLFRKYNFKGLDNLYKLMLAQNVDASELEGYHHNLMFSPSDSEFFKLRQFDPNSNEAIDLLTEIAAAEGRAESAVVLMGQRKKKGWTKTFLDKYATTRTVKQNALADEADETTAVRVLTEAELREAHVSSSDADVVPLSFTEANGRLYLEALPGSISVATLTASAPVGLRSISSSVFLDEPEVVPTDFMIFLVPVGEDPFLAIERASTGINGSSGWQRVLEPYAVAEIEAKLEDAANEPMDIVVAIRPAPGTNSRTLGCFSYLCETLVLCQGALVHRPRRRAPLQHQRARLLEPHELATAKLLTPHRAQYEILSFPKDEPGLLLCPVGKDVSAVSLPWAFPHFARRVVASVEVAHEDALGFRFGMALVRPDQNATWTTKGPDHSVAFSGWHKVSEGFRISKFAVTIPEVTRAYFALHLAVYATSKTHPVPPQTFWRRLVLHWD